MSLPSLIAVAAARDALHPCPLIAPLQLPSRPPIAPKNQRFELRRRQAPSSSTPSLRHGETAPTTLSMDEIADECKTFFFAGHDTTSHLLTWATFLLSTHPEWQHRLRDEVRRECGDDEVPTGDALNRLKLVNLFLLETLRLYGPVSLIQRKAGSDLDLGGIRVPEGAILTIPIATIHRDKEVWGEDADEFRPERFENGVTRATKHPNALLSFSSGPRSCIGQNFAMIEAKAVVDMILQRFALELSSKYVHAPMDLITLRPRHGLPMLLKRL